MATIEAERENTSTALIGSRRTQARRAAIIAVAEALIRETGDIGFPMTELAKRAGVSPTTPYNLFGTKSAILYALLHCSADSMFSDVGQTTDGDALAGTIRAAESLANVLTGDPAFYRPLYAYLMGVPDPNWRPAFIARAREYWLRAFAPDEKLLLGLRRDQLGNLLVVQALGCVEMWVHQELKDNELKTELRRAVAAVLLGLVPLEAQAELRPIVMTTG